MHELSELHAYELRKGAGSPVDEQIQTIITDGKVSILPLIAKMNFKNITKLHHE